MKVENLGARLWTVDGIPLIPGQTTEIPDAHAKSIEGIKELKVVEAPKAAQPEKVVETVEFKEVPSTKAELATALAEKGIKFDHSDSKAELQALYDASK